MGKELLPLARRPDGKLDLEVMSLLAAVKAPEGGPVALAELKYKDSTAESRASAYRLLGRLDDPAVIPVALAELLKPTDAMTLDHATAALARVVHHDPDRIVPMVKGQQGADGMGHLNVHAAVLPYTPDTPLAYRAWVLKRSSYAPDTYFAHHAPGPDWLALDRAVRKVGRDAVPHLRPLLTDPDRKNRYRAAIGILTLAPDDQAAAKVAAENVNPEAYDELMLYTRLKKPACARVADLLTHEKLQVRISAARVLARAGEEAADAVPTLIERCKTEPVGSVRAYILYTLNRMGPAAAKAALPVAREHLTYAEPTVRFRAAEVIAGIDPTDRSAGPALVELARPANSADRRTLYNHLAPEGMATGTTAYQVVADLLYRVDPELAVREGIPLAVALPPNLANR